MAHCRWGYEGVTSLALAIYHVQGESTTSLHVTCKFGFGSGLLMLSDWGYIHGVHVLNSMWSFALFFFFYGGKDIPWSWLVEGLRPSATMEFSLSHACSPSTPFVPLMLNWTGPSLCKSLRQLLLHSLKVFLWLGSASIHCVGGFFTALGNMILNLSTLVQAGRLGNILCHRYRIPTDICISENHFLHSIQPRTTFPLFIMVRGSISSYLRCSASDCLL